MTEFKRIVDMVDAGIIPPVIDHETIKTVVVHGNNFHADDVAFVALIKECHNPNVQVIRTNDLKDISVGDGTIVADVGGDYDGEWMYDHHQFNWSNPDEARSAVGLFYDDWCNPIYHRIKPMIREIDRFDAGGGGQCSSLIGHVVTDMNPLWCEERTPEAFNQKFDEAVELLCVMIRARIMGNLAAIKAEKWLDEHTTIMSDGIVILNKFVPWRAWAARHPEVKAIISIGRHGKYNSQLTTDKFPKPWLEQLPQGVEYIHRGSRGLVSCDSLETAVWAASQRVNV